MSERGYRISSRLPDGLTRVGIAFSLLVNDADEFFLPVPAAHAKDGGEIMINSAKMGQVLISVPKDNSGLVSCFGYVAIPVEPFDLPPLPNLRPPPADSRPPVVLAQVQIDTVAGQIARTRFRYDLTNPNRTEFGTLVHLTKVSETSVPLGSLCTSDLTDWGVVAAVDHGGRAVVATPLTAVLTSFLQHGLRLATAQDKDRAFTTKFRMLPFALPKDVESVKAVFEVADSFASKQKRFAADRYVLTFDDFMEALGSIVDSELPLKTQDLPPALARDAMPPDLDLDDGNGLLGLLWINYANERVTRREPGDDVPKTEISVASILQQAREASVR